MGARRLRRPDEPWVSPLAIFHEGDAVCWVDEDDIEDLAWQPRRYG